MKACAEDMQGKQRTKSKPAITRRAIMRSASGPATLWIKLSPADRVMNDQRSTIRRISHVHCIVQSAFGLTPAWIALY